MTMPRPSRTKPAHMAIYRALKSGQMVRPDVCEKCGDRPGLTRNGRSKIHAHHPRGYDRPFDVEWICFTCHRREPNHAATGDGHGNAKLTSAQVATIRERIALGHNRRALAREYGVTYSNIKYIKRGQTWRSA